MKASILILFLSMSVNISFAQFMTTEEFRMDLDFVYKQLKKSVSYKTQKENQWKAEKRYQELSNIDTDNLSGLEVLERFYQLIDEIKDYHNFISIDSKIYRYSELKEKDKLDSILYRSKNYFNISKVKLDSIESSLKSKDVYDYEGIYHLGNWLKVAVIKTPEKLIGIILESQLPTWGRGEEIFYLIPKGNERFRMITGSATDKRLSSALEGFKGGTLRSSGWKKSNSHDMDSFDKNDTAKYIYRKIMDGVDYIKVSTFGTSNSTYKEAINFYNNLNPKEFESNIILDLRNNRGGGIRNSKHLFNKLKQHKGNFYILTNYYTVSHGEEFVLIMKHLKNVTVLGERTIGMLTYGSNFGPNYTSPSGRFKVVFTDLKDNWKQYLKYEGRGLEPDINLSEKNNWIDQVLVIINKDSSIIKN